MIRPRYAFHRKICGSIGIRLGALPAVLWFFYQTTPYAFAVCLITLPIMSMLLGFAILGCLASCALMMTGFHIFLYAGRCFAYPCHLLLSFLNLICMAERALPCSVLILGRPELWQLLTYYAGLAAFVIRIKTLRAASFQPQEEGTKYLKADAGGESGRSAVISAAKRRNLRVGREMIDGKHLNIQKGLSGLIALNGLRGMEIGLKKTRVMSALWLCLLLILLCVRSHPQFQFLCLDIGQGSCNLIRHGTHAYLFDAGSSSVKDVWEYRIDSTLKYYGISKLDMVFLSHGDLDHIDGIEQMLAHYHRNLLGRNSGDVSIGKILLPELPTIDDRLAPIIDGAGEHGIRLCYVNEGDSCSEGDMRMDILGPSDQRITGNSNEDCIVMVITYKTLQIWCMADLEKDGEDMFIRDCSAGEKNGNRILIAGHHGSKNATSEALLKKLKPDLVFISCGKNNRYGHPAREMLDRLERAGIRYLRTDQEGAIEIVY